MSKPNVDADGFPIGGSFIRLLVNDEGELELMSYLSPPPSYEKGFYPDEIGRSQTYYIVPVNLAARTQEGSENANE